MAENIFPYELPENWRWSTLGNVCEFERGITFPASAKEFQSTEENIPCVRTANVQEKLDVSNIIYVDKSYTKNNSAKLLKIGDVIMSSANSKELVGKTCYVQSIPFEMTFGGFVLVIRTSEIFNKYVFYFLRCEFLFGKFRDKSNQTVNIANINTSKLLHFPIPLPPLDEQKRIVAVIESLFEKLDAAKSIVQKILDGYELRRAAILHKAFTGELTKNFRADSGLTLDDWQQKKLREVCKKFVYGTSKKSKPVGKIIVIRMGNLQGGEIDWKNLAYSDDEEDIEKYKLSAGDVLFNRTNSAELVGKTSIYRGEYPAIYAGYLIKLDYEKNFLDGEYLNFILNSPEAKIYCDSVKSNAVNQSNINAKKISGFEIPLPPLDEQKEIVRILDSLLDKEQRTKEIAEKILSEIDLLKRTILTRAFRGTLGTKAIVKKI